MLAEGQGLRIERIVSKGQTSPAEGWYEQEENEWVTVLRGEAELTFADGRVRRMHPGDYIRIAAGEKHRVSWTVPDEETIWLAVHYA